MISHSIKLCTIAPILVKIYGNGYLLNYAFLKILISTNNFDHERPRNPFKLFSLVNFIDCHSNVFLFDLKPLHLYSMFTL